MFRWKEGVIFKSQTSNNAFNYDDFDYDYDDNGDDNDDDDDIGKQLPFMLLVIVCCQVILNKIF